MKTLQTFLTTCCLLSVSALFAETTTTTTTTVTTTQTPAATQPVATEKTAAEPVTPTKLTIDMSRPLVVVEDFVNRTNTTAPSLDLLKSRIENEIINTRKFTYLERGTALETALAERRRIAAGAVQDPTASNERATELTPLVAAGYAIYGDILFFGFEQATTTVEVLQSARTTAKLEIQLRYANIETGEVLASKIIKQTRTLQASSGNGVSVEGNFTDQTLNDVVTATAKEVVNALMELAFPAKVVAVNVKRKQFIVNLTEEQTDVNKLYDIFSEGEEIFDPDTGKSLDVAEYYVGRAMVTRCLPKMAFLTPMGDLAIEDLEEGMRVREVTDEQLKQERRLKRAQDRKRHELRF